MAETNKTLAPPQAAPPAHTTQEPAVSVQRAPESRAAAHHLPQQAAGTSDDTRWYLRSLQRAAGNYALSRLVTRQSAAATPQPGAATQRALNNSTGGQPLPEGTRASLERSLHSDLSDVRVHTGERAAQAADELGATAFTSGQDVFFGAGNYAAGTTPGKELLAHEVVHTVQQRSLPERPATASTTVSQPDEPLEQQAATVAHQVATGQPVNTAILAPTGRQTQRHIAWRADGETPVATTPPTPSPTPATEATAPGTPTEEVSLTNATLTPSETLAAVINAQGRQGTSVPVRLGNLARGPITVRKAGETYRTTGDGYQAIPLTLPVLQPLRDAGVDPVLALRVRENTFEGYTSIATQRGAAGNPTALVNWIKDHSQEMGWLGMDVSRFPTATNELRDGVLRLQVNNFQFRLGGFMNGSGNFGLDNETVTFNANATIHVQGLTDAQLEISRDAEGKLNGQVEAPVSIARFSGNILARYADGTVNVRGTVRYTDDKFSGEITLLVTDAATARNVALEHLGPEAVQAAGEQSSGATGGVRPGPRALAGWGTLDFAFTEWLTGKAQVIVDNEGHITVIGEITPQAEVELFAQRDYIVEIFTLEVRARYGVPLVGSIFLFANVGMQALAKFGPGKLYNIAIRGRYSTDPRVFNEFSIEGTLNISAFAGLRMRAEGGAGLELLGHDIKAGVGLNALAGVRGYVEATPTIGYREKAAPEEGKAGEFYIKGHMELAAQPFLGLSGDLFVELDSPWWSPAPDKKWTWPIGSLEYPLPGEFGIGADVDYVIGSDQLPEIQFGEVDFNKDKFMTDLINDKVPPRSKGEQEKQGEWQEGETTGAATEPQQVDTQGAPPDTPATGRQEAGEGEVPATEQEARERAQGMQAIGHLVEESRRDPFSQTEMNAALGRLRQQYHYSQLDVERRGEDWRILAAMSPPREFVLEGEVEAGADYWDRLAASEAAAVSATEVETEQTGQRMREMRQGVPQRRQTIAVSQQGEEETGTASGAGLRPEQMTAATRSGIETGAETAGAHNHAEVENFVQRRARGESLDRLQTDAYFCARCDQMIRDAGGTPLRNPNAPRRSWLNATTPPARVAVFGRATEPEDLGASAQIRQLVDVNNAHGLSASYFRRELESLPGIGRARMQLITAELQSGGRFNSFSDFKTRMMSTVPEAIIDGLVNRVTFG